MDSPHSHPTSPSSLPALLISVTLASKPPCQHSCLSPPSISLWRKRVGDILFKVTPPQHEQVLSQPRTKTGSGPCSDGNLSSQAHRSVAVAIAQL
ncbi:hypothetical protein BLNAU_24671 [Blattamonas nauphoetae]|uniref:Uncharacterized protein n=1 Tax=Blattamonas nauphoetae TaxID=2049346 RepID=A0ABQ9WLQ7_9EUKA|nr:hypothetical protein BLNAU_24671 [Blattamonas nauphoetae]